MKLLRSKKGFTLVELIVVIVIIAILAAALVTSLVGYINKAKNTNAQVEANNAYIAAQSYISEMLGTAKTPAAGNAAGQLLKEVDTYLGSDALSAAAPKAYIQACVYDAKGTIVYFDYLATNGLNVFYSTDAHWEVAESCSGTVVAAGKDAAPYDIGTPKA